MLRLGRCYYAICRKPLGHRFARAGVRGLRALGLCRGFRISLDALELDHVAVAGLMRLWSRIHWSSGDGMMPPEQLLAIYRLAVAWPVSGDVVELGAWTGLTTSYLATACRVRGDGRVYAVDTFQGTKEGGTRYASVERYGGSTLACFRERIERAAVSDIVEPLVGTTSDVARRYEGRPVRLLLIDADHSYEGTRSDFRLWSRFVATGGLIVFHDYLMPEVARFVDEEMRTNPNILAVPGPVTPNIVAVSMNVGSSDVRSDFASSSAAPKPALRAG